MMFMYNQMSGSENKGNSSDGMLSRQLGTLYDIAVSCALPTQCQ